MKEKLLSLAVAFLSGALIVTIYVLKHMQPIVNAENYTAKLEQNVKKLKQSGAGNVMELTRKEKRAKIREIRKNS